MADTHNTTDTETYSDKDILDKASKFDAFPEAEDYDPMRNAFTDVTVAGPSHEHGEEWRQFGLALRPILWGDNDTGKRVLCRNGKFIQVVSDRYKVLPHERLAVIADDVASDLGMVEWDQFGDADDWYITMDDHIIMSREGRRMHALYAQPDPVPIGEDDEIHIGMAVHNSIDGSLGFNVGLFTFRHACANMVWMGVNADGMDFDDREVVAHHSHKHTKGLSVKPGELRATMEQTLFFTENVTEAYQQWREEYVSVEDALGLLDRAESGQLAVDDLPEWVQAGSEAIDNAQQTIDSEESINDDAVADDGTLTDEAKRGLMRTQLPGTQSRWATYNDLTESIWHSDSTQDTSKRRKMKAVHSVFEPSSSGEVTIR